MHLDPLNEDNQRLLIGALHAAGQNGEAGRQFRRCCETLKQDLGVQPEAETRDLALQLSAKASPRSLAAETIAPAETLVLELPTDELLRTMRMLADVRKQMRVDRALMVKMLLQLELFVAEKRVNIPTMQRMCDRLKQRVGDRTYLAPAPGPLPLQNGHNDPAGVGTRA